uniref:collagen alpha-1(I) chain-like n=1 Tax=Callithrix jacchus TaxID=9483 RepID=UPI0023DD124D|nr:collagen alpha-1(I) chain-like [Callithrix jacchus]
MREHLIKGAGEEEWEWGRTKEKRRFYKILLWFTKVSDTGASLQNKETTAHSQKGDKERKLNKRTREMGKNEREKEGKSPVSPAASAPDQGPAQRGGTAVRAGMCRRGPQGTPRGSPALSVPDAATILGEVGDAGPEATTVPISAAARGGEVGTPLEEVKPSSSRPPGRERARELGLETRIQHPGDLQARPGSGGHFGQGEGFGSEAEGSGQGRKFRTRPQTALASPPPTPLLLCDPRTHSLFSRGAGFQFPGPPGVLGPCPLSGANVWAPRSDVRMQLPCRGPDPARRRGPRSTAAEGRSGATEQPKLKPREDRD